MPKQHFDGKGGGVIGDSRRRTCPPPDTGRGTGPDGSNKRSSERTAEDGTERSDVGSPRAAGYVRGGAPDEIMGGAGERTAKTAERSSVGGCLRLRYKKEAG